MSYYGIYKSILIKDAFKFFELELPIDLQLKILDHLYNESANVIIKSWNCFFEKKERLISLVLDWRKKIDSNIIVPWQNTYKLLYHCVKNIRFLNDDPYWWCDIFKKMFKRIAPLEFILVKDNNIFISSDNLMKRYNMIENCIILYKYNITRFINSPGYQMPKMIANLEQAHLSDFRGIPVSRHIEQRLQLEVDLHIDWALIKNRYTFASDYCSFNNKNTNFKIPNNLKTKLVNNYSKEWIKIFDMYNCPPEWIKFWLEKSEHAKSENNILELNRAYMYLEEVSNNDLNSWNWRKPSTMY